MRTIATFTRRAAATGLAAARGHLTAAAFGTAANRIVSVISFTGHLSSTPFVRSVEPRRADEAVPLRYVERKNKYGPQTVASFAAEDNTTFDDANHYFRARRQKICRARRAPP